MRLPAPAPGPRDGWWWPRPRPVCDKWLGSDWMSGPFTLTQHTAGISPFTPATLFLHLKMLRKKDKKHIYLPRGNIDCVHYPKWDIGVFILMMMSRRIVTVTGHKADGLRHSHSADKMWFEISNKVRPFNWVEPGSSIEIFQFMFQRQKLLSA